MKFDRGIFKVEVRRSAQEPKTWTPFLEIKDDSRLWWSMSPLPEKFDKLQENAHTETLLKVDMARLFFAQPPAPLP